MAPRRGAPRCAAVRPCDAWDCGFAPPNPRMQYTATAFAQPIRRVFGLLFRIEEAAEFTALAGALTINIGTLSPHWVEAMEAAALAAGETGRPCRQSPLSLHAPWL